MRYEVSLSRKAHRDLAEAIHWLVLNLDEIVDSWQASYDELIARLQLDPSRYAGVDENPRPELDLRVATFGKARQVHLVYFTIASRSVLVYRIRHAARDSLAENDL